jgi:glycolate oxidase iron-sulfur subunit
VAAFRDGNFDAILTNAGGCGSTLKEYEDQDFASRVKDVSEFLASIELREPTKEIHATVTYQDSCHLAHGQRVRSAPRAILKKIPGLTLKEMRSSDHCCGSAGIYNVLHTDLSLSLLEKKMQAVNATGADRIVTANPGCMLQLRAGVERWGKGQRVSHVIELLDEAYQGK